MRRDVVVAVMVAEALLLAARERDEDPGMKAETMVGRVRADARRRSDFDCRANVIVLSVARGVTTNFLFCQLTLRLRDSLSPHI